MKKFNFTSFCLITMVALMTSCQEDVDLDNMDSQMSIKAGLALPLGEMEATVEDFIGKGSISNLYVGEDKVLFYRDTFQTTRQYHDVVLDTMITDCHKNFDVHQALTDKGYLDENNKITYLGNPIKLEFPMVVKLSDINKDENDERLDSAHIITASFNNLFSTNNLPINQNWISKIEIELGKEFSRKGGNTLTIYEGNQFQYNNNIPVTVDNFTLCLMKNRNPQGLSDYFNNVIDSCEMQINVYVTIPSSENVVINSNAKLVYDLNLQFLEYEAIWGYFKPSSKMYDEDVIDMYKEWDGWKKFENAKLPFSDPIVNAYVTTKVAGAIRLNGDYVFSLEKGTKDTLYATFDINETQRKLVKVYNPGTPSAFTKYDNGYLPLTSQIGDSARMHIQFTKDCEKGHIDHLFERRPDYLGYKFLVDFNIGETPQLRVQPNTAVHLDAELIAPLKFNKGMNITYADLVSGLDLSELSLDSLFASSKTYKRAKDENLVLVFNVENYIPIHLAGVFRFYDENDSLVMDPTYPDKPLTVSNGDTLQFNLPKVEYSQTSYISEPGTSVFTLYIDKKHIDHYKKVKKVKLQSFINADGLNYAFDKDSEFCVKITADDKLKVHIGIAANMDAIFDFSKQK